MVSVDAVGRCRFNGDAEEGKLGIFSTQKYPLFGAGEGHYT